MAVTLTVSESIDGAAVSDALSGGGTGVDLGSVINGSFTPVTDKIVFGQVRNRTFSCVVSIRNGRIPHLNKCGIGWKLGRKNCES